MTWGGGFGGDRIVKAKIADALVIRDGTPVHVAGIAVGKVIERRLVDGYSQLTMEVDESIPIAVDARLLKRKPSLLADPILEIDPGTPGADPLPNGAEITQVSEETGSDSVLRDIDLALPNVQVKTVELRHQVENLRARLRASLATKVEDFRDGVDTFAGDAESTLARVDERLQGFESQLQFDAKEMVNSALNRGVAGTRSILKSIASAQQTTTEVGQQARDRIADFDITENNSLVEFINKVRSINRGDGTLGSLVNDPEPADDFAETAGQISRAVSGFLTWEMRVSLRSEYYIRSGMPRNFVSLRMRQRTDAFYLLGVTDTARGTPPDTTLTYDPATGQWRRDLEIRNDIRWTAQWGKIYGPFAFRAGFKDSTPGVGLDFVTLGDNLELNVDLFELNFADHPRLKVSTAWRVFHHLYLLAGVDDVLNRRRQLDIAPGPSSPRTFDDFYFGRDYFLGATLRFSDEDLASLLVIGGSAVSAAAAPPADDDN